MKNTCKDCKYNDKAIAKKMFYSNNYCTLWGCQMSGKDRCKYKLTTKNNYEKRTD